MSVSPQPPSATISNAAHAHSSPQSPNTSSPTPSNAQLAHLLHASYRESESLHKELANTRRRLEKAERLLACYAAASTSAPTANNGTPAIPEPAQRAIAESEARADRAEHARDEADARRRVLSEAWEDLNRYLASIELRAADARAGFARLVADGGGHLVLTPIPMPGHHPQPIHTPAAQSPAIMLVPPSSHRSHRHSSSLASSQGFPPLPPPPSRVRPRSGSFDEPSYPAPPGQPPTKRSRNDRGEYDHRPHTSHTRGRPIDIDTHPTSSRTHLPSPHLHPPHIPRSHAHSRSSSRSSQRSLSIDEMLLEATTDDPRPRGEPQSPRTVLAHHQHPQHAQTLPNQRSLVPHTSAPPVGPLEQPGELRTYQTHIFAPPVTGAPMKKGKPGSSAAIANGSPLPTPPATTNIPPPPPTPAAAPSSTLPPGPIPAPAPAPPPAPVPHAPFPPTNAQGQRICRQCGLAGRYKEGKCVEKWGPGPEGPGTVCDRCRKKMKRVERRGTLESQAAMSQAQSHSQSQSQSQAHLGMGHGVVSGLGHAHTMPLVHARHHGVVRTDTMPVSVPIPGPVPGSGTAPVSGSVGTGGALGPGGTQLLGNTNANTSTSGSTSQIQMTVVSKRERSGMPGPSASSSSPAQYPLHQANNTNLRDPSSSRGDRDRDRTRDRDRDRLSSPPPAIATLQTDEDEKERDREVGRRRGGAIGTSTGTSTSAGASTREEKDRGGRRPMSSAAPTTTIKHLPSPTQSGRSPHSRSNSSQSQSQSQPHSRSRSHRASEESSADAEGDADEVDADADADPDADMDADGDADGDGDADADPEADLLEAVDAAEREGLKVEDGEGDE